MKIIDGRPTDQMDLAWALEPLGNEDCERCLGTGFVLSFNYRTNKRCPACEGEGIIVVCRTCDKFRSIK